MLPKTYDQPLSIQVVEGDVVILGPGGLAGSMTPDAAEESARRLHAAAQQARNSRAAADTPDPPR